MTMRLAPGEELTVGEVPFSFRICTNERGDEFFPISLDRFKANIEAYQKMVKRDNKNFDKDCQRLGPIPKVIYALTVQHHNGSHVWDTGEYRDVWWAQVICGERNIRWEPYGPGGLCGVWIERTTISASRRDWKDRG